MLNQLESFVKTYSNGNKQYKHTAMVNHRGTVVAFAMDNSQSIHYTVLELSEYNSQEGEFKDTVKVHDSKYWLDDPKLLSFPNEIEQVGFGIFTPVKLLSNNQDPSGDQSLPTTGILTADAPFQVYSDNQHIYVFRQSITAGDENMFYKLNTGDSSATASDEQYLKKDNKRVPLVNATLLVDRYILSGTELKLSREVRFRRSQNRTTPASAKDSLGAQDMEGNPFYESTKELDFIQNLSGGRFSVLLLPTQVADIERWQIFAYNSKTKSIDSFNIERGENGFFNTQGTQLYTSPDKRYKSSVLERKPGKDPFTGLDLVPIRSKSGYAEWALQFNGQNSHAKLDDMDFDFSEGFTVEAWVKYDSFKSWSRIIDFGNGAAKDNILLANRADTRKLAFHIYGGSKGYQFIESEQEVLELNQWIHLVVTIAKDGSAKLYKNGVVIQSTPVNKPIELPQKDKRTKNYIGKSNWPENPDFHGQIDEVRIWNRARSSSEIKETMNHRLVGDELGLVAYWRLDEGSGSIIKDQTPNGSDGELLGNFQWIFSNAPIGDHPGMRRTSFGFNDRTAAGGLAARLYYEQEKLANAERENLVKQNARVLLTAVTATDSDTDLSQHIAAVDFGVSVEGKLAQVPDVIYLPVLHSSESSEARNNESFNRQASLQQDINTLDIEIRNLGTAIETIKTEIKNIETDEKNILEKVKYNKDKNIQTEISRLQQRKNVITRNQQRRNENPAKVEFFKHSDHTDLLFTMEFTGVTSEKPNLGQSNDEISAIRVYSGHHRVVLKCYQDINFGTPEWIIYQTSTGGVPDQYKGKLPNDTISSIRLEPESTYQQEIQKEGSDLEDIDEGLPILKKIKVKQDYQKTKETIRTLKEDELQQKKDELASIKPDNINLPSPIQMPLLHVDSQGLTVSSGLLGFAKSNSQPFLFESADGKVTMYFSGVEKQFFAAYYDVSASRARWLFDNENTDLISLVAISSNNEMSETAFIIENSSNGEDEYCKVTIKNEKTELTETWNDVPREVNTFVKVLNGETGEKVFVGKLETVRNNSAASSPTTIVLQDKLTQRIPAQSTLIIDGGHEILNKVKKTTAIGSLEIEVEDTFSTISLGAAVYLLPYNYSDKASINRPGYRMANGSLHVRVVAEKIIGNVSNESARFYGQSHGSRWIADAPGSTFFFNGENNYLNSKNAKSFQHQGDLTMETWVRPLQFTDDAHLITFVSGEDNESTHYSLGLKYDALELSALSISKREDFITLKGTTPMLTLSMPASVLYQKSFTIEAWIRLNPNSSTDHRPILGTYQEVRNRGLHFTIKNKKPYLGFYYNDVDSESELADNTWYHVACSYDIINKTQAIFVDGVQVKQKNNVASPFLGETELVIGGALNTDYYLDGDIAEVRIWTVALTAAQLKENRVEHFDDETAKKLVSEGLLGYYHFENNEVKNRCQDLYHGELSNGLKSGLTVKEQKVEGKYRCFASVNDKIALSTKKLEFDAWHHLAATYNQSYALKFNNDNPDSETYCEVDNDSALNITEDLTIEAFIQPDKLESKNGIISKGQFISNDEDSVPYALYLDEDGSIVFTFQDKAREIYKYSSSETLKSGQFYWIAVVRKRGQKTVEQTEKKKHFLQDGNNRSSNSDYIEVDVIKSIEFKNFYEIRFYITDEGDEAKQDDKHIHHEGGQPIGNNHPLYIGRSNTVSKSGRNSFGSSIYSASENQISFHGLISEIRLWNEALDDGKLKRNLNGTEKGLTAWWRFEENHGTVAHDAKGTNHAQINGAEWRKNPDPNKIGLNLYFDGNKQNTNDEGIASIKTALEQASRNQFTLGALQEEEEGNSYHKHYTGTLEEVRIWKTVRHEEAILDNMFTRLKGERQDLIANYTFDEHANQEVQDQGIKGNHLQLPEADEHKPTKVLSTAPISNDTAQVRSAMAGIETDFHDETSGRPAVTEYADLQRLENGNLIGIHKRCYAYVKDGEWLLATGYKVGNLVTEWIGQAQFDPQVVGYIEGAPPVPSENLTEGYYKTFQTFNGTSEVTLQEAKNVKYTVSASKKSGFNSAFDIEREIGIEFEPRVIIAPMGIGFSKKMKIESKLSNSLSMESNGAWTSGEGYGAGQNISRSRSVAIGGNWDVPDKDKWLNQELTRRFIPANMGFAFVESETADIYALRLKHNGALIAFRMLPNPDIPRDTNIIPFPINNRYTKQGTLDGRVGYAKNNIVLDPDYSNASGYGEYSYFKPKEAYELKKRIEREEQQLIDFYKNFGTNTAPYSLEDGMGLGAGLLTASSLAVSTYGSNVSSVATLAGGAINTMFGAIHAFNYGNPELPERYARRNIVNTYVWTADGGFYEESTQISDVRSESKSGDFLFKYKLKGSLNIKGSLESITKSYQMSGMLGGSLNIVKSKKKEEEKSFSIEMKLLVPDNLQRYTYNEANDTSSGVKGAYDENTGNPINQPGKVDAFRFMTFYLEPKINNFEDLFGKVVDPIWLEQSNHPNAAALRAANQSDKKPKCWRVFHRVTFVSRILPDFPADTSPSLEKKMKDLNIASNYELVRRLDPFVRDYTANFVEFNDAVKAAVQTYLPELSTETELNQIVLFLADYYGVDDGQE